MKKVLAFVLLILTVVGVIGGIGYTIYEKAYFVTVGLVVAGFVIWPRVKELFKELTK